MNMTRKMVTTSRPKITRSIWEETRFIFLKEIAHSVCRHDIPDELIINVDQTSSKFVPTDNVTMAVKGTKHIPRTGANDKRGITVTLSVTLYNASIPINLQGKDSEITSFCGISGGFFLVLQQKPLE